MQERLFNCIAPHLHAQVLYADRCGFVVVMERADHMASTALYPYIGNSKIEELFDECRRAGLPVERKYCDVGYFDGVYKIVDFGS